MTLPEHTEVSRHAVEVRRLRRRGWYLAVIGIVMVMHGGGVLFGWYPTARILELLYPGREPPGFETRDMVWAGAFLIVGAVLIALRIGRMAIRRPVIRATEAGVLLSVGGPFTRPAPVPWRNVREISVGETADEFGASQGLLLRVDDGELAGSDPWGATWKDGVLAVPAHEWDYRVEDVARMLTDARASFSVDAQAGPVAAAAEEEQGLDPNCEPSDPQVLSEPSAGADSVETGESGPALPDDVPASRRETA